MTTATMNTSAAPVAHLRHEGPYWVFLLQRLSRDLGYLLPLLFLSTAAFTVLVTLAATSAGTLIIWVGLPLGVATLWTARGFANLERSRLTGLGEGEVVGTYRERPASAPWLTRALSDFRDGQMWRDLLHGVVTFPLAVVSWSVTITWIAGAVGGTTSSLWARFLPENESTNVAILEWLNTVQGMSVVGLVFLVTAPWVLTGLARLHLMIGQALLGTNQKRALRAEVQRLKDASQAAAHAESTSLQRIERDLHDGPQQRLIRLQMDAAAAERALDNDPEAARAALATLRQQSAEALAELRALTRGFAPPLLSERGLEAAVRSLAERSPVAVDVTYGLTTRINPHAETALYFAASEALANVAKHSQATRASAVFTRDDAAVTLTVTDNGIGGASLAKGTGLRGLEERLAGAGGSLTVTNGPQGGTVLTAEVPCE
ncbi:sensor histidine kinase [Demequina sp. B12]|uniref:sensor histidine kinase n=1 Tax=Demequina sp. B12 TaxID=2992757 RepID=UPI00237C2A05|nr:sensor histidine kinase [Demequina sp. B12]MDE0572213.1 sensor histidine kinase [Demequina sp. B12]